MLVGFTLTVEDLVVRKSGYTLLDSVSFEAEGGDFLVILGPNGAGKTTLLRAIAGERPHSGSVLVGQDRQSLEDIYRDPEKWFRKIGQVPTENVLHDKLPVSKALEYIGKLRGLRGKTLTRRTNSLLKEFGISDKRHSLISKLSSGERKKVNICAELLTEPGLLLLDEPTTNLDPHAERELMCLLSKRARNGTTIVVVSHTIRSLDQCRHIILMGTSQIREEAWRVRKSRWKWSRYGGQYPQACELEEREWLDQLPKKFKDYQTGERFPGPPPSTEKRASPRSGRNRAQRRSTDKDVKESLRHFWIIFARQISLLYYEGWRIPIRETVDKVLAFVLGSDRVKKNRSKRKSRGSRRRSVLDFNWMIPLPLFVALAFGPLAGLLLLVTLPTGAFIESPRELVATVGMDAGDASTASFLTGLVAFLVGLLGSFREIAREISIYKHERLKGLQVSAYLLAKSTVISLLYGLIAPVLMFLVLFVIGNQDLPARYLVFGGGIDILVTLIFASVTGVALGLCISSIGSSGEWATVLMGISVISNAVLSGLVTNKDWEEWINFVSILVPSRWAMEGLKTSTEIYCWAINWVLRDHYSPTHLLAVWFALIAYTLITFLVAYLGLHWKDKWFTPIRRIRLLISKGNYIYLISCCIVLAMSWGFYSLSSRAYDQELFVTDTERMSLPYKLVGRIIAAQCEQQDEPPPPPDEGPTSPPVPTSTYPNVSPSPVTVLPPSTPIGATPTPESTLSTEVSPSPTPTSPSPSPEPREFRVTVSDPVALYYSPTTQYVVMRSLPANSTFTLLSRAQDGSAWIRAQVFDETTGQGYVGWVQSNTSPLSEHMIMVQLEPKTPPDCAKPIASTYRAINSIDIAAGNLGNWQSNASGDIAIVVDLYREEVGIMSDRLTLHFNLNGETVRTITLEPQQKRFLLQSGVYNLGVESGDTLSFELTPSESQTLNTLQGYVTIFFVSQNCEFGAR